MNFLILVFNHPLVYRIIAYFFYCLSCLIIISEVTIFLNFNLCVFGIAINYTNSISFILPLAIIPLVYLISSTLYGLFNLKISGIFGIYSNKQTDAESLLMLTSFMCRIAFPLGLNFIQILKLSEKTTLEQIMGTTDFIPIFGYKFTIFYPTILIILCLCNFFNIYGSLLNALGLSSFGFESEVRNEQINEGRLILTRSNLIYYILVYLNETNKDRESKSDLVHSWQQV